MSLLKEERKFLCIGLMCIDLCVISTEYPKEDTCVCTGVSQHWQVGGNAANDCEILSALGCPCELWTAIATDTEAREDSYFVQFLVDDLKSRGINFENCVYYKNSGCPYSFITLNCTNGTRTIIHQNKDLPELTANDFKAKFNLNNYKWIHFEGRNIAEVPSMIRAIQDFNESQSFAEKRITVSVEMEFVELDHSELTPLADYIFVNKLIAKQAGFSTKEEAAKSYLMPSKPGSVYVFPWGDEGALARCSDGRIVSSPAFPPAKALDTLGAGDTFLSSTIYALSEGHDVEASIRFGCRVAGAKCGAYGLTGARPFARKIYEETFSV